MTAGSTASRSGPYAYRTTNGGAAWRRIHLPPPEGGWPAVQGGSISTGQFFVAAHPTHGAGVMTTVIGVAAHDGHDGRAGSWSVPSPSVSTYDGGRPVTDIYPEIGAYRYSSIERVDPGPYVHEEAANQFQMSSSTEEFHGSSSDRRRRTVQSDTSTLATGGGSAQARARPARSRGLDLDGDPGRRSARSRCPARCSSWTRITRGLVAWQARARWSKPLTTAGSTGGWCCCRRSRLDVCDHRTRLGDDLAIFLLDRCLAEGKPSGAVTN